MRPRAHSRLFKATIVIAGVLLVISCGDSTSTAIPDDGGGAPVDGSTSSSDGNPDSAPSTDAASRDGDAGPDVACSTAADCHSGGTCFEGICVCPDQTYVQPDGTCGATPPAVDCMTSGGTCVPRTSQCPRGQFIGSSEQSRSCGDFIGAACCFAEAACKGPADLACCADDAPEDPSCINGWRTCSAGKVPFSSSTPNACGG